MPEKQKATKPKVRPSTFVVDKSEKVDFTVYISLLQPVTQQV